MSGCSDCTAGRLLWHFARQSGRGGKQIYAADSERKHFGFSPALGEAESEESAEPKFLGVPAEQSVLRLFDESLARLGLFEFLRELRELFDNFKVSADSVGTL